MPAGERYLDPRIDHARAQARARGQPLFIFSGVFGLLAAADPVPWYDHALRPEEVDDMARALAHALQQRAVSGLTAILEERARPGWAPYHDALRRGCEAAGVHIQVELWPSDGALAAPDQPQSRQPEHAHGAGRDRGTSR